ncbi:MAG: acyl-CoA dehydrogenase family protein [Burkholderiaceae bacterium]|nr:acyl-CoA dehydrogenase family protein [Burkholderiaceae bacterium]
MDFSLNDDHLALRDAVQRFCDGEYPAQHRGNPETPALATQRWAGMAELGLLGLPFDADLGGSAQGAVELMLVAQELGRCLGGGGFVSSIVLAGQLLARTGSPRQCGQWLPLTTSGELKMALALYEEDARYDWFNVQTKAVSAPEGYVLNGRKTLVLHGDTADLLLVVARTSGAQADREGITLFAVDANMPGVLVQGFDTLDGRRAAHIELKDVAVSSDRVLGLVDKAYEQVDAALDGAIAALCAEAAGALDALIQLTTEHLRTRKQFGVPLAKFQVLQHRVADMVIALEQTKSMACAAAMSVQDGDAAQRRRMVSAAKVLVSQLGRQVGLSAIQLHGAMGMTDECRVGHYAKRLIVIGQMFGDSRHHLQRMMALS